MAKLKRYDYSQKGLVPVLLEEQLVPGSLEFAIHTLIETRMDMSVFEGKSLYLPQWQSAQIKHQAPYHRPQDLPPLYGR
jgi:hypothetical protein